MNLITPFDFIDLMPERQSVAIIGNAPSLRNSRLGEWIESHDIVVRFNECAMHGFEPHIGSRTDILVTNPYAEKRQRPPVDGLGMPRVILVLNPQTRRGEKQVFAQWAGDCPVLFSYTPDIKTVERDRRKISLTTGTYALSLLNNLIRPKNISIVGFTMFLAGASAYYWSDVESPTGLVAHSPIREAEVFIDLINTFRCEVEVGEDVQWVAQTVGVPLSKAARVRPLPGWTAPDPLSNSTRS